MERGQTRQRVEELQFCLYQRAIHPELFQIHEVKRIEQSRYHAEIWILGLAHVVTVQFGDQILTELIATDPEMLPEIREQMHDIFMKARTGDDLSRLQIRVLPSDPSYNGKTLADVAADRGLPNNVETGIDLAIELQLKGGFSAIFHAMDEQDVIRIMQHPISMIETDGDPVAYGVGFPHPRSYGAFPRVLARYVRELGVLTLEEAVRKMTSMPADQYNQKERGRVVEGAFADIVVFDRDTISDQATYTDPHRYPTGIHHVMVNGSFVIRGGALTGERPGRWIRGPARPERVTATP